MFTKVKIIEKDGNVEMIDTDNNELLVRLIPDTPNDVKDGITLLKGFAKFMGYKINTELEQLPLFQQIKVT
jgi:hypothetical protein